MEAVPQGLHLGLAAWIHQTGPPTGFLTVPADPVTFDPRSILPLEVTLDPFPQAEMSRVVNLLPQRGQPADVFGARLTLWERLPAILREMVFASRPLTQDQAQAQEDAKRVLYTVDPPLRPSAKYRAYLEMSQVVQDLLMAGASSDRLIEANADWEVLGFKSEVERARAVILLIGQISAVGEATAMSGALDASRLLSAGEQTYAPSYFAPLSAADPSTWLTARVSLADLSAAASAGPVRPTGGFFSVSQAVCEFAYATLTVIRPWFASEIFEHDDWRLTDPQAIVSSGDGRTGLLPAYAAVLYVARVLSISGAPVPVPAPVARPADRVVRAPVPGRPAQGVVSFARPGPVRPVPVPATVGPLLVRSETSFVLADRLRREEWRARLARLDRLDPVPVPATPAGATGPQIVGFGCVTVPSAPKPNPLYVW